MFIEVLLYDLQDSKSSKERLLFRTLRESEREREKEMLLGPVGNIMTR